MDEGIATLTKAVIVAGVALSAVVLTQSSSPVLFAWYLMPYVTLTLVARSLNRAPGRRWVALVAVLMAAPMLLFVPLLLVTLTEGRARLDLESLFLRAPALQATVIAVFTAVVAVVAIENRTSRSLALIVLLGALALGVVWSASGGWLISTEYVLHTMVLGR